jgi:hypothetical protein
MKLVCVKYVFGSDYFESINEKVPLTIGKTYDVIRKDKFGQYYIKDDTGHERWYNSNRFILIDEERERKLKQLGI